MSQISLGCSFYWLCDCSYVKEVLEYNGSIHQLKRWTQELIAYEFVYIHCLNKMMKGVDGFCRHIDPLIHRYLVNATTIRSDDIKLRPFAYNFDFPPNFLTHIMFHTMILSLIPLLSPLFPLLPYSIIAQFVFLPTCKHYSQV